MSDAFISASHVGGQREEDQECIRKLRTRGSAFLTGVLNAAMGNESTMPGSGKKEK